VKPVRVLVANQPRLMQELVLATISDQPDVEIVGEVQNENEILTVVEQVQPDFLVVALSASEERPSICDTLLPRYPQMRILALAPERNRGIFYWSTFQIHSGHIESSEEGLLEALRGNIYGVVGRGTPIT
jgi:chemotaxis response regulator CheB